MNLGAFSVSLAVKDINASLDFYQKLGFQQVGGDIEQNWVIVRNGDYTIGLFQEMFEKNMLTFNPGWDSQCNTLENFTSIYELQEQLRSKGLAMLTEADAASKSFIVEDPDGNPILFDQHV